MDFGHLTYLDVVILKHDLFLKTFVFHQELNSSYIH